MPVVMRRRIPRSSKPRVGSGPAGGGGGAGLRRGGGAAGAGRRGGGAAGHLLTQRVHFQPQVLHLEPELRDLGFQVVDVLLLAPLGVAAARSRAEPQPEDEDRHHHETPHAAMMAHPVLLKSIPSTSPSSATAATGSSTLIVV